MAAGKLDLTIEQGATFQHTLTLSNGGTAINLTGYDVRMQIRERVSASTTIADLTIGAGISVVAASGQITLTISAADTAEMIFDTAYYDLEIESAGVVTRIVEGEVTLNPEVTRPQVAP